MKVQEETGYVNSNFDRKETQFKVNESAHFFHVISNQLYTRPINAIVRELACNAFDSHIKKGNRNEPITVKFPTPLNPEFYVQDNGVGMSPEQIENLYTVVFASDKQDSNDFTGGFGLGSKSVFSYTDNFTIESVFNGRKYIYKAYKNENGIPAISDLTSGGFEVEQENGVKISFNVKREDHFEFQRAADELFWFETKPEVLGIPFKWFKDETLVEELEGGIYQLMAGNNYYYDTRLCVVMGNVCYQVDQNKFSVPNEVYSGHYYLFVEVGSVTPTASREELQYDKKTISFLEDFFEKQKEVVINRQREDYNFWENSKQFTLDDLADVSIACRLWDRFYQLSHPRSFHASNHKEPRSSNYKDGILNPNLPFKQQYAQKCKEIFDVLTSCVKGLYDLNGFHKEDYSKNINQFSGMKCKIYISKTKNGYSKNDYREALKKHAYNDTSVLIPRAYIEQAKELCEKYPQVFSYVDFAENPLYSTSTSKKTKRAGKSYLVKLSKFYGPTVNYIYDPKFSGDLEDFDPKPHNNILVCGYDQWGRYVNKDGDPIDIFSMIKKYQRTQAEVNLLVIRSKYLEEFCKEHNLSTVYDFTKEFEKALKNQIDINEKTLYINDDCTNAFPYDLTLEVLKLDPRKRFNEIEFVPISRIQQMADIANCHQGTSRAREVLTNIMMSVFYFSPSHLFVRSYCDPDNEFLNTEIEILKFLLEKHKNQQDELVEEKGE